MKLVFFIASFLLVVCTLQAQPPHAKAWGKNKEKGGKHRQRYTYNYYPGIGVYYNVDRKRYAYRRNDEWIEVERLPRTIVIRERPRVIYDYEPDIWIHRPRPGVNINVNASF